MFNNLKTQRIETKEFILNVTKVKHVEGTVIGYMQVQDKPNVEKSNSYAILGQEVIYRSDEYDEIKLHLIKLDLGVFTYEMTIKFYDSHTYIKWFNLYTNRLMYESQGKYLDDIETSGYSLVWENSRTSEENEISCLELDVKKAYHINGRNNLTLFENGIDINKFVLDFTDGADTIRAYDENHNMVLNLAVSGQRINNIFNKFELHLEKEPKDNIFFMNSCYRRYSNYEASLIMILQGTIFLLQCEISNLNEKNIKNLKKVPYTT